MEELILKIMSELTCDLCPRITYFDNQKHDQY